MDTAAADPKPSVVEKLNLRWLHRLLTSSIGRKFVMGLTGLGLCGFLVVHLAGNLLLYAGPESFDRYAHALHEQEWLPLAEAGLFALFLLHIYLAFVTAAENRAARHTGYALKQSKRRDLVWEWPAHNWMFLSGAVVLGFLILHLVDMKFEARPDVDYAGKGPYAVTVSVLRNPYSAAVYLLGTAILGFHLAHGFASAFQSLGLSHPKYTPLIKSFGYVFAVVIAAGFFSLPLSAWVLPHMAAAVQVERGDAAPTP
uniref:Succinate dehydrogenase cytochrome b subunit n=1 Tax=Schlesneria paludicola TaxID=360056 RepID=A0A7C4LR57_9PLAN